MPKPVTLPAEGEILENLRAVDGELEPFAPYFFHWAEVAIRDPWQMVSIILAAIELYVEESSGFPAQKGALAHYAPEIVEALCGQNKFAEIVKRDLEEILNHIGMR